jgi:hypothetical protein
MKVKLPCREVARLLSDAQDRALPASRQARLRMHILLCRRCRTLEEQMSFLRRAMERIEPEEALRAFITELNEDEQAVLIALAWVGRGDYEASEWAEAKTLAAERNAGRDASDYLLGLDGLGDLLEEGVAAFGLSLDDADV